MSDIFRRREDAFEAQFARGEARAFRLRARRDRLFGAWTADRLGLPADEAEAYARAMADMAAKTADDSAVLARAAEDLRARAVAVGPDELARAFEACADRAAEALADE